MSLPFREKFWCEAGILILQEGVVVEILESNGHLKDLTRSGLEHHHFRVVSCATVVVEGELTPQPVVSKTYPWKLQRRIHNSGVPGGFTRGDSIMDSVKTLVESGPTILIEKPLENWLRFCRLR